MKIKSANSFRHWYKNLTAARKHAAQFWDENFIGTQYNELSGFFAMYHGDKTQIYDFLRKEVEMAEDGQAIYEFVQNAADSNSTKFYMFYDENYLIIINNGSVFSKEGVKSILNIGQSFGKHDPDKIGRYGIGFKLVHRLVGKSSGLDELLNIDKQGHRGPILFSWNEKSQFNNFLTSNEFEYVDCDDSKATWLLKILITNFPVQPNEKVKDIDYIDIEPFQEAELKSFQAFLNSCSDKIDINSLDSGTVFFLKLGNKKFEYLERQKQEYIYGLSTSMHFLKSLDTLVINEDVVKKDIEAINVLEFTIQNGSDAFKEIGLTEIRDLESDVKFKLCYANNAKSAIEIKKHPNIYKYFPAVKEVNNLSFIIHSNLFELSSNRQNLTETPINKKLLELLSKLVINKMEDLKTKNIDIFKSLFISILMSDETSNNFSGNGWQSEYYYKILLEYIKKAIPIRGNGFSDNAQSVKINKLNPKFHLNLTDFGLSHIQWFEWDKDDDKLLINEAKKVEKLGLKSWDIADLVENAKLESINKWIESCQSEIYKTFLDELEAITLSLKTKEKIYQIKLFKFSNDKFYSVNEIITLKDNLGKTSFKFPNCFFSKNNTKRIKNELIKLGLVVSELLVEDYPGIFSSVNLPDDKKHYDLISKWCIENANKLSPNEKKTLFLNFINKTTKFDNVGEEPIKKLELFYDNKIEPKIKPLSELITKESIIPNWLQKFQVNEKEYFEELSPYLIQKENIFEKVIIPNINIIKDEITEINEINELLKYFKDNKRNFFAELIIKEGANRTYKLTSRTEDINQCRPSSKEVREFVNKNLSSILKPLPLVFDELCKDEIGIIKGEDLYNVILHKIDINKFKENLVEIIKYDIPQIEFLLKIIEIIFINGEPYDSESFEYKILKLACDKITTDDDRNKFRSKIKIKDGTVIYNLTDINKTSDKLKIGENEFSLSKILPSTYQNSNLVGDLITLFIQQGISSEKLNALFGVNEELDVDDVYKKFVDQVEVLEGPEQFFFLVYYHKQNLEADLSKLEFDLSCAVCPSDFALEEEKLPKYLQDWITKKDIELSELEKIGVFTENSTLVSLRKFFLSKGEFNQNTIAQDPKLSDGKMFLNTLELLKEKGIELNEHEFTVFKEVVRVINLSRTKDGELKILDKHDFKLLEEKSTKWEEKEIEKYFIYLYEGEMLKLVSLNEIQDYVFYRYSEGNHAIDENKIYLNKNAEDRNKVLMEVAAFLNDNNFTLSIFGERTDETEKLKQENEELKKQLEKNEVVPPPPIDSFLNEVNEFISELERTEWNNYVPGLKNLLQDFANQPLERQKLFNMITKVKLAKEKKVKFEDSEEDFNVVKIGNEKYFVHSARGAFAYIHPSELLKMNTDGYKMALDFGKKFKIYETAEEILQLNTNHILAYQYKKSMEELFSFCQANKDANKHLLIIDKDNAGEKSKELLKLFNIEDDYQ